MRLFTHALYLRPEPFDFGSESLVGAGRRRGRTGQLVAHTSQSGLGTIALGGKFVTQMVEARGSRGNRSIVLRRLIAKLNTYLLDFRRQGFDVTRRDKLRPQAA